MSDKYRIYWSIYLLHGYKKERVELVASSGCNGERHLVRITQEFLDENRAVESKFLVTNIDLGLCDGDACAASIDSFFEAKGQTIMISRPEKT